MSGTQNAFGATDDAAWTGSGDSTLIAAVKAQAQRLLGIGGARLATKEPDVLEVSASASAAAVIFSQDTTDYESVAVQVTAAGAGCTVSYECSNDNANWVAAAGYSPSATSPAAPVTTSGSAGLLLFPCNARYFRARISSYGSGTVSAVAEFRKSCVQPTALVVGGANQSPLPVNCGATSANTSNNNPCTLARVKAAASTNATSVKGSTARLYAYAFYNNTASAKSVKLYNKASAPVVGTDAPAFSVLVPANGAVQWSNDLGIGFSAGIAYAITGAIADSDTTAVAADDVHGFIAYA